MSKLKIGIVLDDSLDTPDGVAQYVLTLGTWLSGHGHEVHYLVGETKRHDVAHVHSLSRNIGGRFNGNRMSTPLPASRRKLLKLLEYEKFDVLHVQMPYSPLLAGRIIKAASRHTVIVGTFHILPYSGFSDFANRVLAFALRASLKRFDQVFAVSSAALKYAERTYRISGVVLPNMVDEARFRIGKPIPVYKNDRLNIIFLGRLVPRKGCKTLLQAISILRDRKDVPAFRVTIGGKGPLADELKKYVVSQKLDDIVTFAGFVPEDDKPDFLASGDIAVFPSSGGESFGIVLIEAMATGRAVVLAGDNPGYRSVMGEKTDLLFAAKNNQELADKLAKYLGDNKLRKDIISWQSEYVRQFDVNVVGKKLVAAYDSCLARRNKA